MQTKPLAGVVLTLGVLLGAHPPCRADETPAGPMPLRNVVLFSSGVGYFQRAGRISGATNVDLSFRAEQINDILKSLVIVDPAGQVQPVSYTTQDSLSRRLRGAGLSVDGSISLGTLLRQFQGARVRLETGGESVEGRILSVSTRTVPLGDILRTVAQAPFGSGQTAPGLANEAAPEGDTTAARQATGNRWIIPRPPPGAVTQVEIINLDTDNGLRAVSLDQVTRIKLLDDRLDRELRESLELLATGLDDRRRTVQLRFGGDAAREVRAGYLQEMPVWKTSYRLVLDKAQKPYLQGWAIVENTTDDDWKAVHLSLVSGRPISFVQDLYQPLYVPRPVVAPQVIGSPLPQTFAETLDSGDRPSPAPATAPGRSVRRVIGAASGGVGGGGFMNTGSFNGPPAPMAANEQGAPEAAAGEQLARSVAAQAQGTERGDLFEYAIGQPVTLARQQAAMVPIVAQAVDGEKLSIYDPNGDAKHALNGFQIRNNTGLHLSGGPITVFQDGVYAGDGQINNVQPGENRLISYAVDLDLVASREEPTTRQDTLSISAKSGVLVISRKQRLERVYTFRNKSSLGKTVLVQQNMDPEFTLVQPAQSSEKSAAQYRFKIEAPGQKTVELKVVTERPVTETVALLNANLDVLVEYSHHAQASEKLKAALVQLVERRRKVTDVQAQRATIDGQLAAIAQEQSRIRQNMAQLDRNSPLYQQYVKKLTDQETQIEKLREESARLRAAELTAQQELRAYVDDLTAA